MQFVLFLSQYIVPFLIFTIVVSGILERVQVYETFIKGAKDGFYTVLKIMPTLVGLMVAVGVLRASGFLEFLSGILGQWTEKIGFPGELVPLSVVKMFSSSAATGLLTDIYKEFGTDSYIGRIASISMACTETIFYTMSVYDCKGEKDKIYTGRSDDCDGGRTCGECMACRKNVNNLLKNKFRDRFFL